MIGQDFVQKVNIRGEQFLAAKRSHISEISPDATPLVDALGALMRGGKKLRPILAWIGWRAAQGAPDAEAPEHLGTALELFQAAALVHDDVIDRSDTRRGQPSTHKWFEQWHAAKTYSGAKSTSAPRERSSPGTWPWRGPLRPSMLPGTLRLLPGLRYARRSGPCTPM